jgi:hypothetical protein
LKSTPVRFGSLKGIGGDAKIEGIGTLRWVIEDDYGKAHQLTIPNSLYFPKSPKCLLSPKHLAQVSPMKGQILPTSILRQSVTAFKGIQRWRILNVKLKWFVILLMLYPMMNQLAPAKTIIRMKFLIAHHIEYNYHP